MASSSFSNNSSYASVEITATFLVYSISFWLMNLPLVKFFFWTLSNNGKSPIIPKPALKTVIVDKIVRDDSKPILKYEPNNPDADKNGYVAYPNINPVIEMSDLIEATRSYQANVAAFQSAKTMASSAISILKG